MNEELNYFQGKWSDLVDFINREKIDKTQIQTINTFMARIEDTDQVMTVMFYWSKNNV